MRGKKHIKKKSIIVLVAVAAAMLITGCSLFQGDGDNNPIVDDSSGNGTQSSVDRVDTGFVLTGPDSYDSADTPVIVDINKNDKTVTFLNLDIDRQYTLSMDGTTKLYDKYGEAISLAQLQEGDIVDITFLKSKKHLTSMQLSEEAWSYGGVERYEINTVRREVSIGGEIYKLSDSIRYFSDGISIEEVDLNPSDVLTFTGMDTSVYSVRVEKGHGYLRLVNDENFIGGWIEIGQKLVQRITDDMLLTVPEGSYQVNVSHNGGGGIKNIIINRNDETTLDIGDLKVAEVKKGMVLFSLSPANADLYIDGTEVDPSQPITLDYGLHQIIAKAAGYSTLTQYIRVGQESAGLDVVLDSLDAGEEEEGEDKDSTDEGASEEEATTSYYKVYIDAPEEVEVYLDGNYVGISPCSFRKSAGSHVITLRKTGYETRSYTIQVDNEDKDISYSFVDLIANAGSTEDTSGKDTSADGDDEDDDDDEDESEGEDAEDEDTDAGNAGNSDEEDSGTENAGNTGGEGTGTENAGNTGGEGTGTENAGNTEGEGTGTEDAGNSGEENAGTGNTGDSGDGGSGTENTVNSTGASSGS